MSETTNPELNVLDDFAASLWAILPEEMANTIAGVKKDFLTSLRSTVDAMVDHDLHCLERTLEQARRKRAAYTTRKEEPEGQSEEVG